MTLDRLLNQEQAAELLGISPSTVNSWRVQGRGPAFVRISTRCVRYRYEDLIQYIESKRFAGAEAQRIEQHATNQGD